MTPEYIDEEIARLLARIERLRERRAEAVQKLLVARNLEAPRIPRRLEKRI